MPWWRFAPANGAEPSPDVGRVPPCNRSGGACLPSRRACGYNRSFASALPDARACDRRPCTTRISMLYYLIATLYILSCLVLLMVVLLQQGKGGDIASAFGGSSSQTAFGARSGATLLSRATAVCAALFMIGALALAVLGHRGTGIGGRESAGPHAGERAGIEAGDRSRRRRHPRPRSRLRRSSHLRRRSSTRRQQHRRDLASCGSGGTGRRTSLRGWRSQERGGSNPPFRTTFQFNKLTCFSRVVTVASGEASVAGLCESCAKPAARSRRARARSSRTGVL